MESKYLKYKFKYHQLKQQLNKQNIQSGGSNNEKDESFYYNQKDNKDKPTIYLFKASWCGHCKSFRETWNGLAKQLKDKVNFVSYDSDKNSKEMKEWRVQGFPSIIYRKGNSSAIEYTGDRDIDSLYKFINNNL